MSFKHAFNYVVWEWHICCFDGRVFKKNMHFFLSNIRKFCSIFFQISCSKQTKKKRLNFHNHQALIKCYKTIMWNFAWLAKIFYFVIPYTQDIISLNGSTVSNQKYSTLSLCHQDICGLLTWHGTKIPTAKRKRKSILILLLEGFIFDTELQAKKNYYW